jgi:hypothetical protein
MPVIDIGRRLIIRDGPIALTAWVDRDGKIAISHTFWGLRLSPADLRTILNELAPQPAAETLSEDALFAALHDYRQCSEDQARGIISAYLAALEPKPCD